MGIRNKVQRYIQLDRVVNLVNSSEFSQMKSFKEPISKRSDRHEQNINNLINKVKNIEVTPNEYIKRLRRLEDGRNQCENEGGQFSYFKFVHNFTCS